MADKTKNKPTQSASPTDPAWFFQSLVLEAKNAEVELTAKGQIIGEGQAAFGCVELNHEDGQFIREKIETYSRGGRICMALEASRAIDEATSKIALKSTSVAERRKLAATIAGYAASMTIDLVRAGLAGEVGPIYLKGISPIEDGRVVEAKRKKAEPVSDEEILQAVETRRVAQSKNTLDGPDGIRQFVADRLGVTIYRVKQLTMGGARGRPRKNKV